MSDLDPVLIDLAHSHRRIKYAYEALGRRHLSTVEGLEKPAFWALTACLAERLVPAVARAASFWPILEGFVHSVLFDPSFQWTRADAPVASLPAGPVARWQYLAAFVRAYAVRVDFLRHTLQNTPLERGGDSFEDLCDLLPLAGPEVFTAIQEGQVKNAASLQVLLAPCPLASRILSGEFYVVMTLEDALLEDLPSAVRSIGA